MACKNSEWHKVLPQLCRNKKRNLSVFDTSMLRETFWVNIYTCTVLSKLDSKVHICLSFNLMHETIDKVSYQLVDAYPAKI